MIKNTDTKLAFVCSVDPGIYSSIVSDVNFFRLMKNLRVKFSCCLWRNGHTMSSMTKSLKRVSWNYFNMSKQLGSIDWSKSKICYYLTPKWNHLVRKRSYLKYEFGANTLLSDAKTKQIWYLKIEKKLVRIRFHFTVALKVNRETKNGAAVLSNGIFEDNLS